MKFTDKTERIQVDSAARFALVSLAVAALYAATAQLGLMLAVVGSTVTLVWAPSGIALAALLTRGNGMAGGVFVGALVANIWTGIPWPAAAAIALGNTLEALIGACLLTRVLHFRPAMASLRDVVALIAGAALLSTTVSALIGTATLWAIGTVEAARTPTAWLTWWLGDMMGVLVVTPGLLLATRPWRWPTLWQGIELACLLAALAAVGLTIFTAPATAAQGHYATTLAVFPFVIWGALRFRQWGATLVTLAVAALAIRGTVAGFGPFAVGTPAESMLRWCAFGIVTAATGLLLAASVAAQRRTLWALKKSHRVLERRVLARTRDLAAANVALQHEMAEGRRLEVALIRLSEDQQQAVGRDLHDGLGQLLTSLSLMGATLQQQLLSAARPEGETARRIGELIQQATTTMRTVARGLCPVELEFGGLAAALEELARQTRRPPALDCVVDIAAGLQVHDPLVALNLYRVAQEAVNNAVKYSRASLIRIRLAHAEGDLRLVVQDDGIGIDPERLPTGQGLGMASMRFRAGLLGGQLDIGANHPSGTCVTVTYPEGESAIERHEHRQAA